VYDGDLSEPFEVTNGAKQGCVLGPILFIMLFSAMLYCAFLNSQDGMRIRYRTDGKLFNLRDYLQKPGSNRMLSGIFYLPMIVQSTRLVMLRCSVVLTDCQLLVTTLVSPSAQQQGNHAIAKMTARCAQYVSALKIVGSAQNQPTIAQESPHHNLTIRWGGEIISEVFHPM